ncbi:O-methyltransferase [Bacillus sp. FJAT-49732]|uniref:tRNA 5-hydroxyuridine methyltransferase n=1 Tax=Lederbergia citrisecunda TaxID=2833583 RepID=A0A942YKL5_9BACI|nr:O-methyltransferase [Lederbergia citrisecunda]MBS4199757.1 O-methyltransferase [Lederbergia citrisecunda]
MNDSIKKYLESYIQERNSFFTELEQFALDHRVPIMEPTGIETMLQIMKIQNAKSILEIGTAIGYSALRMADAIQCAQIVTLEMDEERISLAKENIKRSNMGNRVTVIQGNALDLYDQVAVHGPFDAIFIDAAKGQYGKFFTMYKELLTDNGCIYTDNVLFKGLVADENSSENKRLSSVASKIKQFNNWLYEQKDFTTVIIPVGDGLAVSKKI